MQGLFPWLEGSLFTGLITSSVIVLQEFSLDTCKAAVFVKDWPFFIKAICAMRTIKWVGREIIS